MAVLNVNGLNLTEYVNTTCDEKLLRGSSRTQTKRAILIKTIESLPDNAIESIFNRNSHTSKWIPKLVSGKHDTDEWYGKTFICEVCNGVMIGRTPFCPYCGGPKEANMDEYDL